MMHDLGDSNIKKKSEPSFGNWSLEILEAESLGLPVGFPF